MQSVQRRFGRLMKRSADENQVAILLKDFDQVDNLLIKIVDSTKAWRDAWPSLLAHQNQILTEFEGLYAPIIGSSDASLHKPVSTIDATLVRTTKLKVEYEDLKKEILEELAAIDERMINPASQAKNCLLSIKKTVKKRDDRKLDYERHQGRVDNYSKRSKRSDRENASLAKAEEDLAKATEDYHAADEHLRQYLPPLITAVFSLLPHLLSAQIEIQNKLLAHYYSVIYNYCEQEQFPSDPPQPLDQTVTQWEQAWLPVQQKIEGLATLANGKFVRANSRSTNGRRPSNIVNRLTGNHSLPTQQCSPTTTSSYGANLALADNGRPHLDTRSKSAPSAPSTVSVHPLFIQAARAFKSSSEPDLCNPSQSRLNASSQQEFRPDPLTPKKLLGIKSVSPGLVGKRRPPPPPPPPRPHNTSSIATFVTALYDFRGESAGDLAFLKGDRIRVLQRTDKVDDWWEGALNGVKGSFPANYVELVN